MKQVGNVDSSFDLSEWEKKGKVVGFRPAEAGVPNVFQTQGSDLSYWHQMKFPINVPSGTDPATLALYRCPIVDDITLVYLGRITYIDFYDDTIIP